jgi:hypothetical protein
MAQRNSGYERRRLDHYATPPWPVHALVDHVSLRGITWEPCADRGQVCKVLEERGLKTVGSDIEPRAPDIMALDFLSGKKPARYMNIVTNPPYAIADEFIQQGLLHIGSTGGKLCLLLPSDFDYAKGRSRFFDDPRYHMQIKLRRRIVWIKRTDGKREHPSSQHCWHIWMQGNMGERIVRYHDGREK